MAIFNSYVSLPEGIGCDSWPSEFPPGGAERHVAFLWRTWCTVQAHGTAMTQTIFIGVLYETSLQNHCWRTKQKKTAIRSWQTCQDHFISINDPFSSGKQLGSKEYVSKIYNGQCKSCMPGSACIFMYTYMCKYVHVRACRKWGGILCDNCISDNICCCVIEISKTGTQPYWFTPAAYHPVWLHLGISAVGYLKFEHKIHMFFTANAKRFRWWPKKGGI